MPRAPLVDVEQTRQRAELYGWVSVDRDGTRFDYCPEDRREVDAELRIEHRNGERCDVFAGVAPFEFLRCVNLIVTMAQLRRPKAAA